MSFLFCDPTVKQGLRPAPCASRSNRPPDAAEDRERRNRRKYRTPIRWIRPAAIAEADREDRVQPNWPKDPKRLRHDRVEMISATIGQQAIPVPTRSDIRSPRRGYTGRGFRAGFGKTHQIYLRQHEN
jgi:hypothetical protein